MRELEISNRLKPAFVDDEDYERCSYLTWFDTGTIKRKHTAIRCWLDKKNVNLGDFILSAYKKKPNGYDVHHIDKDPLNNQKYNLCYVSTSLHRLLDGAKYPYFYKGKWVAEIKNNQKITYLGRYANIEHAQTIIDRARIQIILDRIFAGEIL